jgi:predicted dehydrogenase
MERLKIAVVGLHFGRWIIEELLQTPANQYFEIAGVCDLDSERARKMASLSAAPVLVSLDDVLATDIPVIGLFTGPAGRAELIRKIIRAGKDVITTKPFELDPEKAREVLKEARELGRVVHLNSPAPRLPENLNKIKCWQETYALGRPIACRAEITANYREEADGGWQDDPLRCPTAPIFRLGIYLINDLIYLLGQPERIQVISSRIFTGRPTPDNAQLAIGFKNGVIANIFASFCIQDNQYYSNSLTLNFQNGTIYHNVGPRAFTGSGKLRLVAGNNKNAPIVKIEDYTESSGMYQWGTLYDDVLGKKPVGDDIIEQIVTGLKVIRTMARAEASQKTELVS